MRHYYGWNIVGALAITETISWGVLYYAFTVFLVPMERELGWTRAESSAGFSIMLLVVAVMSYPVGAWVDRHGARGLMTVGSTLAGLLVIAWSQVTDLTHFYLIWAAIGVCAACIWYDPAFAVVTVWFQKRRSRALAVITLAAGFASTIFVPLAEALRASMGWRDATLILGLLLLTTTVPLHALVLRRRPSDLGLLPDGGMAGEAASASRVGVTLHTALHSPSFWTMTLAFSLVALAAGAVRVHFIPMMTENGIDPGTAALLSGGIGITQVIGRILFAPVEERVSVQVLVSAIFALQAAAMMTLLVGISSLTALVFVAVFGAAVGAQTLARATLIADIYGVAYYGRISSVISLCATLASTAAPAGAGLLFDGLGDYTLVLLLAFAATALAAGVMTLSRRP